MAQTALAISPAAGGQVQISVDMAAWVAIGSNTISIAWSGGDHIVGSTHTLDGNSAIVTGSNKQNPVTVTVRCVYEDTTDKAFDKIMDQWEAGNGSLGVRWAPEGGIDTVVGNPLYTTTDTAGTAAGELVAVPLPPDADATSGDPGMFEFSVTAAKVTRSTTTTS